MVKLLEREEGNRFKEGQKKLKMWNANIERKQDADRKVKDLNFNVIDIDDNLTSGATSPNSRNLDKSQRAIRRKI